MARFDDRFPRWEKPLPVRGGIRAQSKHGKFGTQWWAQRWIAVLEGFGLGARLARGRSYARRGQVTGIAIEPDGVRATVQGSREVPYSVTLAMTPLTDAQWRDVTARIAQTPRFLAMLLNGEMPGDIEVAFRAAGCELFPKSIREVRTSCSCPDASNPCKHVAAVYYLVGEEFDRDPFLLFELRGLERDALLAALSLGASETPGTPRVAAAETQSAQPPTEMSRPPVEAAPIDAWPLRRAGRFPFWSGEDSMEDALSAVYREAGERAAALLAETWPDSE